MSGAAPGRAGGSGSGSARCRCRTVFSTLRIGVSCLSWRSVGPCPGPRQRSAVLGLALLLGLLLLLLAAAVPRRWAAPPRSSRRDER